MYPVTQSCAPTADTETPDQHEVTVNGSARGMTAWIGSILGPFLAQGAANR